MPDSTIEQIKARVDIVDLVGQHVRLVRSGRGYKACCPFHAEKHPSFVVNPEWGTWHCFGACGEGGDIFTFVQKREGVDFGEALRILAQRAGVELPRREGRPKAEAEAQEDGRLLALLALAAQYFQAALRGAGGAAARSYLEQRGVTTESIERFGLGFAPRGGLIEHLVGAGYAFEDVVAVGLAGARDDGSRYPLFRERVIFPIRDRAGRTIAFGGRTLGDGQPKYLNGPQTRFFDKSGSLYAIDLAWPAIRQQKVAVVVEGYMDALIAHQSGHNNVVATLGTALTERHFGQLRRVAESIVLALDADAAGQSAMRRGFDVAEGASLDVADLVPVVNARGQTTLRGGLQTRLKVLALPPGQDPDDLIRADPAAWDRLVSVARPVVDFVLDRLGHQYDLGTVEGKQRAAREGMSVVSKLLDPVEQAHYRQRLAALLGVDERDLRAVPLGGGSSRRVAQRVETASGTAGRVEGADASEARTLALVYLQAGRASGVGPPEAGDFQAADYRALLEHLRGLPALESPAERLGELREVLEPELGGAFERVAGWVVRLSGRPPEELSEDLERAALALRRKRLDREHRALYALLEAAESRADEEDLTRMLVDLQARLREMDRSPRTRRAGGLGLRAHSARELHGAP